MATAIRDIPFTTNAGGDASLADYDGQVVLVVNVASKCGLTPQYEGLQSLYDKYHDEGFTILGFPSNDFAGQEPLADNEIKDFCDTQYGVRFPLFAKTPVTGGERHPLYAALTEAKPSIEGADTMRQRLKDYGMTPTEPPEVLWNFEKFLLGRDGSVVARFAPDTTPDDPRLVQAIERELFASE